MRCDGIACRCDHPVWWWRDKHSLLCEMLVNLSSALLYLLLVNRSFFCNKQQVFLGFLKCLCRVGIQ